jgi:hypothetical protein
LNRGIEIVDQLEDEIEDREMLAAKIGGRPFDIYAAISREVVD